MLLLTTLKSLAELRDSTYKFMYNNKLQHAIGTHCDSIKEIQRGFDVVSWLLPVLKENIKSSQLFRERFSTVGVFFYQRKVTQQQHSQQAQSNDGIGAYSSELFYLHLWNLLSCFCTSPTDIKDSFKVVSSRNVSFVE